MTARPCDIDGCGRKHYSKGWCQKHYARSVRFGDPLFPSRRVDNAARLEDVQWMAATGEGLTNAAARLGISVKALEIWGRRHDRESLALLIAHEPKDHNRIVAGTSIAELTGLTERRARQPYRQKRRRKVAA